MANWSTVPPEVLLQMGKRLNRRSLVACLLVNRLWYQLFLPQVWQVALARDWADARFCAYLEDHIHLVQHLEWCDMDWLDHRAGKIQQSPFSSFCAAARFHFRDWNQYRNRFCSIVNQDSMADLLGRLKRGDDPGAAGEAPTNACRLRKLSIALHGPMGIKLATAISSLGPLQRLVLISDSWHETLDSPQDWLQMSQAWLTICLNVEELFVWNLSRRAHAPITTLEPRPPLHFDISSSWSTMLDEGELVQERQKHDRLYYYDHDYLLPLGWEDARFPTLKKLFLANMSMSPETFLRWLERCPNLSSVQWPCFLRPSASTEVKTSSLKAAHHFLASPGFRERLPAHFQDRLKHLWVDRLNLVEIAVSSTFGCTHNLRQVNLRSVTIQDDHLALLIQCNPAIEVLSIVACNGPSSQAISAFLSQASMLRRLEATRTKLVLPQGLLDHIAALVAASSSDDWQVEQEELIGGWACRNLEALSIGFEIAIGNIILESRAVFALVSQLHRLRKLHIIATMVVFSEASGVHLLRALGCLTRLVVDHIRRGDHARESLHLILDSCPYLQRLRLPRRSMSHTRNVLGWAAERGRAEIIRFR